MDASTEKFVESFEALVREALQSRAKPVDGLTPFGQRIADHLGHDVLALPIVSHSVASHRLVDADLAMTELARRSGTSPIGVAGNSGMREQGGFIDLLTNPHFPFAVGPVDFQSVADGPDSTRRVVSFGVHLLTHGGQPVAVLQRAADPRHGRDSVTIDVLAVDPTTADSLISEFSALMISLSVLRGKVVTFSGNQFGNRSAGVTFLPRPAVDASDVILPPGVLDTVVRHVVGIGEQRERLTDAHQHLKRGVLLYGPPGTGKTLTVRHLLSATPATTAVLLTGSGLQFISQAAELARAMQRAIVVLEDIDLVAQERGMQGAPQPLLYAVLDALDGLDGDCDVTFLLTTNRVEVLERALTERPGRVDLAVEIALPDADARRRLFHRYASGLGFSEGAMDAAADRATDTTGSFAKELVRRAVLVAAEQGRTPCDDDLGAALDELLDDRSRLTRSLLGGA